MTGPTPDPVAGPTNSLVDVPGFRVGHATLDGPGWLTGTSVVVCPDGGAVGGVAVRGGAPGTRETDLLDPDNLVDRVDAVLLGGGSALGLAAADGVVAGLLADGRGWPMGPPGQVVPIVPGAIVFDLGRGGGWGRAPGAADGRAAYDDAIRHPGRAVPQGCVGGGTGAKIGVLKGGVGSASCVLPDGSTVAALVVCNAIGSGVSPRTGLPWGLEHCLPGDLPTGIREFGEASRADLAAESERWAALARTVAPPPGSATTIAIVATDATLTKAQCRRMASIAHDGYARALKPVHTLLDGDTVFAVASGERAAPELPMLLALMEAGADCVTRAIVRSLLAAESVDRTADGGQAFPSYRAAFSSALS